MTLGSVPYLTEVGLAPKVREASKETVAVAANIHLMASRRSKRSKSFMLNTSSLHLIYQVVTRPPGVGHNSQCWVLVSVRDKWAAVRNEQILYVPTLAIGIQNRTLWVRAHTSRAYLMDDGTARCDCLLAIELRLTNDFAFHRFDDFREGPLHMRRLLFL